LIAACGSAQGASRAIFNFANRNNWILVGSAYALAEVTRNLGKLPPEASLAWEQLRKQLTIVEDVVSLDRVVVFPGSKDRPILFTALAHAETLLTLDRRDFGDVIGREFYGLNIMLPYEFLRRERQAGRVNRQKR
jgi:hypothetical protein